jgi:TonB family protein
LRGDAIRILTSLALSVLILTIAPAAEPFDDLKGELEKQLRLELEICPDGMLGPNAVDFHLWCGSYEGESKKFRSLWARAMNRIRSLQLEPDSGWEQIGDGLLRFRFLRYDMAGMVLHYAEQGVIVIGLDKGPISCEEAGLAGRIERGEFTGEKTPGAVSPVRIKHVWPDYPLSARQRRLNGNVVLEVIVTKEGAISEICVAEARPDHGGFKQSAVEAVRQWRYEPGTLDGEVVAFHMQVTVSFTLQ